MAILDENLRQMLRELGRALSHAIADSPEVGETLRRIESEGYSLHLVLDCKRDATGAPKFGPAGSIATEAACDAADGRWLDAIFGWMVHVNAWADDPKAVFEH